MFNDRIDCSKKKTKLVTLLLSSLFLNAKCDNFAINKYIDTESNGLNVISNGYIGGSVGGQGFLSKIIPYDINNNSNSFYKPQILKKADSVIDIKKILKVGDSDKTFFLGDIYDGEYDDKNIIIGSINDLNEITDPISIGSSNLYDCSGDIVYAGNKRIMMGINIDSHYILFKKFNIITQETEAEDKVLGFDNSRIELKSMKKYSDDSFIYTGSFKMHNTTSLLYGWVNYNLTKSENFLFESSKYQIGNSISTLEEMIAICGSWLNPQTMKLEELIIQSDTIDFSNPRYTTVSSQNNATCNSIKLDVDGNIFISGKAIDLNYIVPQASLKKITNDKVVSAILRTPDSQYKTSCFNDIDINSHANNVIAVGYEQDSAGKTSILEVNSHKYNFIQECGYSNYFPIVNASIDTLFNKSQINLVSMLDDLIYFHELTGFEKSNTIVSINEDEICQAGPTSMPTLEPTIYLTYEPTEFKIVKRPFINKSLNMYLTFYDNNKKIFWGIFGSSVTVVAAILLGIRCIYEKKYFIDKNELNIRNSINESIETSVDNTKDNQDNGYSKDNTNLIQTNNDNDGNLSESDDIYNNDDEKQDELFKMPNDSQKESSMKKELGIEDINNIRSEVDLALTELPGTKSEN